MDCGWPVCFADIAVSSSDMSLFRNCKNSKKCDGLIPNDPQSRWILLYQWLPQLLLPGCNFTVDTSVSAIGWKTAEDLILDISCNSKWDGRAGGCSVVRYSHDCCLIKFVYLPRCPGTVI